MQTDIPIFLKQAVYEFILTRASFCSPRTVDEYTKKLGLLTSAFPEAKLVDLKPSDLDQFIIRQRTRKRMGYPRRDAKDDKLSSVYVGSIVRSVRTFFRWCADQEFIEKNVAAKLKSPRSTPPIKSLSYQELRGVMNEIQSGKWTPDQHSNLGQWKTFPRDIAMILIRRDTGISLRAMLALQVEQVDLSNGWCPVSYGATTPQQVKLGDDTIEFLRAAVGKRDTGPLFLTDHGTAFNKDSLKVTLRKTRIRLHLQPKQPLPPERVKPWLEALRETVAGNPRPKRKWEWPMLQRDFCILTFALDTGCRREEIIGLMVEALNLDEGWCTIIGKGDKARKVAFLPKTAEVLRNYLGGRTTGAVFLTDTGTPMTDGGLAQVFRRMSGKLGIHLHCHQLRHSFATLFVASGGDVAHLQSLLGHSQISTTFRYVAAARQSAALEEHKQHSPMLNLWVQDEITKKQSGSDVPKLSPLDFGLNERPSLR